MIVDRGDVTFGCKAVVVASGLCAASLAATEAATKTLGFAHADVMLAAKRGFVGGGILTAFNLGTPSQAASPSVWEFIMLPAVINTTGAFLLQGLENFNLPEVARASIRLALIGSPLWIAVWCRIGQDDAERSRLGTFEALDDPAPPYSLRDA